jgi:murein DD-endopeptidase MepM/ murein hydrolase activator NlpD
MMALRIGRLGILAGGVLLLVGGAVFLYGKLEGEMPELSASPPPVAIGKRTVITLSMADAGSGLKEARATLEQGGRVVSLLEERFGSGTHRAERVLELSADALGLQEGEAIFRVEVRDRSWRGGNPRVLEANVHVDTRPPSLLILSRFHYLNQGGAGLVAFRASEPLARCGVKVGERWFQAYPMGGDNGWIALFAIPHDAPVQVPISMEAEDLAGNVAKTQFPYSIKAKKFRHDSIRLSEEFLQRILPYFTERDPGLRGEPQEIFLRVNRELRRANEQTLQEICKSTSQEPLWSGPFLRMANAKPMAGFADRRTYIWKDKAIDEQVHLGVDLASLVASPVEAANRGRVVFAGEMGIYGNTVLLDHGCGLFSMYSHLSQISAHLGQILDKGERLGISGSTGLAGGDHLHFSILVSGVFVNPIEWWDPHWIKDNVEEKMALLRRSPGA